MRLPRGRPHMQGLQRPQPQDPRGPAPYGSALGDRGSPGMPRSTVCPTLPTGSCPFFCVVPSAMASSHGKWTCRAGARVPAPPWGGAAGGAISSPTARTAHRLPLAGRVPGEGPGLLLETSGSSSRTGPSNFPMCCHPRRLPPPRSGPQGRGQLGVEMIRPLPLAAGTRPWLPTTNCPCWLRTGRRQSPQARDRPSW